MPTHAPRRPANGQSLVMPRVEDNATQRALDLIALAIRQLQLAPASDVELFTATTDGIVPASGGGSTTFLRADGVWSPATGGGTVADADYGDVTVTGTGTVWTVDALPESRITGLVADLAAKVPTARIVTTTAPLTIDGGASADLSANRTLAVSSFGTGSSGITTASAGATNILRGDNTWITLIQLATALGVGAGQFGTGVDGAAVMDGATAVAGHTLAASVYTATRPCFFTTLVINSGVTQKPDGWPMYATVSITNSAGGIVDIRGGDGAGGANSTGGGAGGTAGTPSSRMLPAGFVGGGGGNSQANGNAAVASGSAPRDFDTTAAPGGAAPTAGNPGINGTAGGVGHGGGGGSSGSVTGVSSGLAGGAGGGVTPVVAATSGDVHALQRGFDGRTFSGSPFTGASGGGGGGGSGLASGGGGGGAGGSGGWASYASRVITGSGSWLATGGNGGAGNFDAGGVAKGSGGGAGGAGGVFAFLSPALSITTPDVNGGAGGAGRAGNGGGAGQANAGGNGADGGAGLVLMFS